MIVLELPIGGAGCGGLRVVATSTRLDVEYDYFSEIENKDTIGVIRFRGMSAYRFRGEMQSLGFVQESYDTLVEIIDSQWLQELGDNEPSGILCSVRCKRHFAVLFSSNGYLEVIAESFDESPIRGA